MEQISQFRVGFRLQAHESLTSEKDPGSQPLPVINLTGKNKHRYVPRQNKTSQEGSLLSARIAQHSNPKKRKRALQLVSVGAEGPVPPTSTV